MRTERFLWTLKLNGNAVLYFNLLHSPRLFHSVLHFLLSSSLLHLHFLLLSPSSLLLFLSSSSFLLSPFLHLPSTLFLLLPIPVLSTITSHPPIVCVCVCLCASLHTCVSVCVSDLCMYVLVYICLCMRVCVCVYACVRLFACVLAFLLVMSLHRCYHMWVAIIPLDIYHV